MIALYYKLQLYENKGILYCTRNNLLWQELNFLNKKTIECFIHIKHLVNYCMNHLNNKMNLIFHKILLECYLYN